MSNPTNDFEEQLYELAILKFELDRASPCDAISATARERAIEERFQELKEKAGL